MEPRKVTIAGKGCVSDQGELDREFWQQATYEEKWQAMAELRRIYYEVMHPGTGSERLDRSIGGTRRGRD